MKRWHMPLMVIGLMLLFRFVPSTTALSAMEVDALVAGSEFSALMEKGESLRRAFSTHHEHPRAKRLRETKGGKIKERARRADLLTSPLVRWVVGGTMMAAGKDTVSAARWSAALAMALAIGLAFFQLLAGAARWWFLGICLATSAVWSTASGAGASAVACLTMTLLLVALKAMHQGKSPLWVGGAWALTMATHPAAVWFLIPIFIVGAMRYRRETQTAEHLNESECAPGQVRLPTVSLALFAVPVLAVGVLVAMWPVLWSEKAMGLFFWITESWRESAPSQVVAGVSFEQTLNRAPQAWTAVLQWLSLLPMTIAAMWVAGLWRCMHSERVDRWDSTLLLGTLLLAGAVNGGLFGGRLSLFSMLLMPTLIMASRGLVGLLRWVREQPRFAQGPAVPVFGAVVLGLATLQGYLGFINPGSANGLDAQIPVPLAMLQQIVESEGEREESVPIVLAGGNTLSKRGQEQWKHAIWTVSQRTATPVSLRPLESARWLLVLDSEPIDTPDAMVYAIPSGAPQLSQEVDGVRWQAYRLQ